MNRQRNADGYPEHRNRLFRNQEAAVFLGVCAGLADFFGFDRSATRVITAVLAFIFFPTVLIAYVLLGLLLKKSPDPQRLTSSETFRLRQRIKAEPHSTLDSVRHRFRELDRRLQRLEKYVTSKRFRLERELDGLRD